MHYNPSCTLAEDSAPFDSFGWRNGYFSSPVMSFSFLLPASFGLRSPSVLSTLEPVSPSGRFGCCCLLMLFGRPPPMLERLQVKSWYLFSKLVLVKRCSFVFTCRIELSPPSAGLKSFPISSEMLWSRCLTVAALFC
jgi:hypothetical protein